LAVTEVIRPLWGIILRFKFTWGAVFEKKKLGGEKGALLWCKKGSRINYKKKKGTHPNGSRKKKLRCRKFIMTEGSEKKKRQPD